MMAAAWLAWAGVAGVAAPMVAYWLVTLAGVERLRPCLRYRLTWLGVTAATTVAGSAAAGALLPLALAVAFAAYQGRRQWLLPKRPVLLVPSTRPVADDTWLVAFADGRAVAIEELRRCRLARSGPAELLVCCGLARSVIAVRVAASAKVRLHLPLPEGFAFAVRDRIYDGTSGRDLAGADELPPVAIAITTAASWRARFPAGVLLTAGLPTGPLRWPKDRRAGADPRPCGVFADGGWTALPDDLATVPPLPATGQPWPMHRLGRRREPAQATRPRSNQGRISN